jgi:hypothetical protein
MPKIPDLVKLDPTALENTAVQYDQQGYDTSDADYKKRFPDLVAGRDFAINNAAADLSGQQDPIYNKAFNQTGLGNINLGSNSFQQSVNTGQPVLAMEQRDRNYFQRLFANNPQRTFGLSPGDVTNIALANTGAQTQFNAQSVGSKINQLNAQTAQNAALAGVLGKVGGTVASAATGAIINSNTPTNTTSTNYFAPGTYATNYFGNTGQPYYGTGGFGDYSSPPTDFGSSYDYISNLGGGYASGG